MGCGVKRSCCIDLGLLDVPIAIVLDRITKEQTAITDLHIAFDGEMRHSDRLALIK